VKVYLALKEAALKYELTAITVRCFELVQQLKTTGCFGLAQLTEDGIISGCEGDLVSTVGMLWAYKLLDEIPWMANPAQIDEINNSLFLAHCTVPKNIVEEYSLRSHFESGLGVGLQGKFSTQPVTLLRLGGKSMERIWIAEGNIIKAGFAENLCRTQAEIKLTEGGNVKDLLNSPLGNHIVMVFGHHMMRLQHWWDNIR
ncbi:MAG: fucose isomerase, partial [Methanococcaceae archaeon]